MASVILKEIAELSNPAPVDYDPEDIVPDYDDSDNDVREDPDTGREHYVEVSKSRLKTLDPLLKDKKYRGKPASRKDLFDDSKFAGGLQVGQGEASEDDEDEEELSDADESFISEPSSASDVSDTSSGTEEDDEENEEDHDQSNRRDKVRELLAQETKSVVEQLKESAQEDSEKGRDIKTQQRFYDSLLDTRIKIQKAIVAMNSLPQGAVAESVQDPSVLTTVNVVKEKAAALFQQQLLPSPASADITNMKKRKRTDVSLSDLVELSNTFNQEFHPWRDETLTKWSDKVKAASGLPVNAKFKVLNQTITQQLRENLTDNERLIERTRTKRGTFNVLGKNVLVDERREIIDPDIFDDLDFYHPLLKDLVERKSLDIPVDTWNRQTKTKVNVKDTRASKGRKLRYHEHEKILNFMAPVATGTWHEDQIDELFASLLGRRIQVNEDQAQTTIEAADMNDGLRIFG